jgi:hypothetical protein
MSTHLKNVRGGQKGPEGPLRLVRFLAADELRAPKERSVSELDLTLGPTRANVGELGQHLVDTPTVSVENVEPLVGSLSGNLPEFHVDALSDESHTQGQRLTYVNETCEHVYS